ncbi:hypothetical protein [Kitasatospora sp. NPDC001175]|uniref:hypothetical protein n=1 Tax=Kitasatospora sp. NPDC001175 TaxID=3157103 RepID=UPI003CFEF041
MRFTTTAGRAVAVALAAATLGSGATSSAQAATTGGTTITNGSCSVLAEYMNGYLAIRPLADNGGCSFGVFDSTGGSWLEGPAPLGSQWLSIYPGPGKKLSGCLFAAMTATPVCDPLN